MTVARRWGWRLLPDESGATAIEYALLAALIAATILLSATSLGTTLTGLFSRTNTELIANMPATGP